jgi:hypothetical protein
VAECVDGKDQYVLLEDIGALRPSLHLAIVFLCHLPNFLDILSGQLICDDLVSKDVLKVIRDELVEEVGGKEVHSMAHLLIDEEGLYYFQVILDDGVI